MKRIRMIVALVALVSCATALAENYPYRSDYLWVATPDHADWLYETGQQAKVEVQFYKYGMPQEGTVNYSIGEDMLPDEQQGSVKLKGGRAVINMGTRKKPDSATCDCASPATGKNTSITSRWVSQPTRSSLIRRSLPTSRLSGTRLRRRPRPSR